MTTINWKGDPTPGIFMFRVRIERTRGKRRPRVREYRCTLASNHRLLDWSMRHDHIHSQRTRSDLTFIVA